MAVTGWSDLWWRWRHEKHITVMFTRLLFFFGIYWLSICSTCFILLGIHEHLSETCQSLDVIRLFTLQPHHCPVVRLLKTAAEAQFHFNVCRFWRCICRCICNVRLWNPGRLKMYFLSTFTYLLTYLKFALHQVVFTLFPQAGSNILEGVAPHYWCPKNYDLVPRSSFEIAEQPKETQVNKTL